MAQVYVGTYGKYNDGSLAGKWFDLEDYSDHDSFYEDCQDWHDEDSNVRNEDGDLLKVEHEFMFQDWEDIPTGMIGESWLSPDIWEWLALDDDDRELLALFRDLVNSEAGLREAQEAFLGRWSSEADFAEQMAEQCGDIPRNMPSYIVIDWEATWDCNLRHDYHSTYHNGKYWIFNNN